MFRLLGFLIGSISSILLILLLVGMPRFHLDHGDKNQSRYDAAIEMLRAKQQEIESVTGRLREDVARVAETVETDTDVPTPVIPATETPHPAIAPAQQYAASDATPPADAADWYSFWNPFRSEIAANGFMLQLERVTGLDYRVVRAKTGVYEVAFSYHGDEERRAKLAEIALATGLDLPDS